MAVPAPIAVNATDPVAIPLSNCAHVTRVQVECAEASSLNTFTGDMVVFIVSGEEKAAETATTAAAVCGANNSEGNKKPFTLPQAVTDYDANVANGLLAEVAAASDFKANAGTSVSVRVSGRQAPVKTIAALGLGSCKEATAGGITRVAAATAGLLRNNSEKPKRVAIVFPCCTRPCEKRDEAATGHNKPCSMLVSFLETFFLELQPDLRFKSDCEESRDRAVLESLTVFSNFPEGVDRAMQRARIVAPAVCFAQELVNAPANYCNPITLAKVAVDMAKEVGLEAEVLQLEEIEKLKMGCYLAVAKGSLFPPQFIHLTYRSPNPKKTIAFVGKGVCFDSGGYNLKTGGSMIELMKFDMGGAGAVLGAAKALGQLRPENVEVHFIVAACENMISTKAYRPGDVITASNGRTVEVGNTDAEGRLTLADALIFAEKNAKADTIVDVATLTGACIVALGYKYAGLWSNKDCLAQDILNSAETAGEYLWKMPLVADYAEEFESRCADINNVGGKGKGGSIIAAVFLSKFIEKATWAHLDIAGTAYDMKANRATGYGVRTLVQYVLDTSASLQ